MIRTILRFYKDNKIRYVIYYYDQHTSTGCIKTIEFKDNFYHFISSNAIAVDFYNKKTLTDFFQKNKDDSIKNMVLIWAHGSGLGYFSTTGRIEQKIDYITEFRKENKDNFTPDEYTQANDILNCYTFLGSNLPNFDRDLQHLLPDINIKNTSVINLLQKFLKTSERKKLLFFSAEDLAEIFKESFQTVKIDILLINSCYLQTFENNFFLKDIANTVIAPQTSFPFLGYNFEHLFNFLENLPANASNALIAKSITAEFLKKYKTEPYKTLLEKYYNDPDLADLDYISQVSFSAINLTNYAILIKTANECGNFFYNNNRLHTNLDETRLSCKDVTVMKEENGLNICIDLTHFISVFSQLGDSLFKKIYESYSTLLKRDQVRITYKKAKYNTANPKYLSFLMTPVSGIPENRKEFIKKVIDLAYKNKNFRDALPNWVGFLDEWHKKNLP